MSKRHRTQKHVQAQSRRRWLTLLLVFLGLIIVAGVVIFIRRDSLAVTSTVTPTQTSTPMSTPPAVPTTPPARVIARLDGCRHGPRFQAALSLSNQAALATSLTNVKGLVIVDPAGNGGQGSIYRHESWDDAGFLGPFITDRYGHIYVSPTPLVSLVENPIGEQNRVYRVDSDSQIMELFSDLPAAQASSSSGNPFGVVGLAYDCETESLYASSVAGSTAMQEVGRIFHIDLKSGAVLDQLEGVDALGLAAFNGVNDKRLYYGLARMPEVHSIGLDAAGNFIGEPRMEFSYAERALSGRDTVRRIRITDQGEMSLNLIDFTFSLQAASEKLEDVLTYRYDQSTDRWLPIEE